MQHQIAIAIRKTDFQRRLCKQSRAPPCVFLGRRGVRRIERSRLRIRMRGWYAVMLPNPPTPIECLQLPALVHSEHVGRIAAIKTEDLRRLDRKSTRLNSR